MKRSGVHRPTIEEVVEISGIETLHPGGFALTRRTAEVAGMRPGLEVLDVSSGRGTQAVFYAREYGVRVMGVDIAPEMVATATARAREFGLLGAVAFREADSQNLPFPDGHFDVAVNECAVGIPDDPQRVLNEMVRVVRPGGVVVIHESIWRGKVPAAEKREIAERYGTTPLELHEWCNMLEQAGLWKVVAEHEEWSRPEVFWDIRKDRRVRSHRQILSPTEKGRTALRILRREGARGLWKALENERFFFRVVREGKLGYCLYRGEKSTADP